MEQQSTTAREVKCEVGELGNLGPWPRARLYPAGAGAGSQWVLGASEIAASVSARCARLSEWLWEASSLDPEAFYPSA